MNKQVNVNKGESLNRTLNGIVESMEQFVTTTILKTNTSNKKPSTETPNPPPTVSKSTKYKSMDSLVDIEDGVNLLLD
tara:strand:+ start:271 stop:504 length:234 start_codon:yes stop_codon:yes gene_type:complete